MSNNAGLRSKTFVVTAHLRTAAEGSREFWFVRIPTRPRWQSLPYRSVAVGINNTDASQRRASRLKIFPFAATAVSDAAERTHMAGLYRKAAAAPTVAQPPIRVFNHLQTTAAVIYTPFVWVVHAGNGDVTFTNMAAALDYYDASPRHATMLNLLGYRRVRLYGRIVTPGVAGSKVILRYSTVNPGNTFVSGDWSDIGTSEVSITLNTTNGIRSSWIDLAAGAKADVHVMCLMSGGDGVTSPVVGRMAAQFQ